MIPFIFCLLLNDLFQNFFCSKNISGLNTVSKELENELEIYNARCRRRCFAC